MAQPFSEPGMAFLYFADEETEAREVTQGRLPRSPASDLSGALPACPWESQRGPGLLLQGHTQLPVAGQLVHPRYCKSVPFP